MLIFVIVVVTVMLLVPHHLGLVHVLRRHALPTRIHHALLTHRGMSDHLW